MGQGNVPIKLKTDLKKQLWEEFTITVILANALCVERAVNFQCFRGHIDGDKNNIF